MSYNFVPPQDNTDSLGNATVRWTWAYVSSGMSNGTATIIFDAGSGKWRFSNNGTDYTDLGTFSVPDHNDLTSMQGGTTSQYYHLTESEYTDLNLTRKYENLSVASGSSWVTVGSFVMANSSISALYAQFSGIDSAGNVGCWTIECAAKRGATASTAEVLNDLKKIFVKDVSAWDVRVQADTTAGAVLFQVLQDADNTSKWRVVTQISTVS